MKRLFLSCVLLILINLWSNLLYSQEVLLTSGENGVGEGGSNCYSIGQFSFQTYFSGCITIEQGVQHSFENMLIPTFKTINDTTITSNLPTCFDALEEIYIASETQPVIVNINSIADFIAGTSIKFLPGFHALEGSYVHGFITYDNFCNGPLLKSTTDSQSESNQSRINEAIDSTYIYQSDEYNENTETPILYPNPNNGLFKIEFADIQSKVSIVVYNAIGLKIYSSTYYGNNSFQLNIPSLPKGLYLIRIRNWKEDFIKKMIVN